MKRIFSNLTCALPSMVNLSVTFNNKTFNWPVHCRFSIQEQAIEFCSLHSISSYVCSHILDFGIAAVLTKVTVPCKKKTMLNFGSMESFQGYAPASKNVYSAQCSLFQRMQSILSPFSSFNHGFDAPLGWHICPGKVKSFLWAPPSWSFVNWQSSILEKGYIVKDCMAEFSVAMMASLALSGTTYFDIGANCGTTSFPIAALPERHFVHAFEPANDMMDILCHSMTSNGILFNQLTLIERAVSDEDGTRSLFIPIRRQDNSAFGRVASTLNIGNHEEVRELVVETITLDTYISENAIGLIALVKTDTQGAELHVMRGAEFALKTRIIQAIFAENDEDLLFASGSSSEELWSYMHWVGFQPYIPTHDAYETSTIERTLFRKASGVRPLTSIRRKDGVTAPDLLWLPAPLYNDHLAIEQFQYAQERLLSLGKEKYLGKAYIISKLEQLPLHVIAVAEACGFYAIHLPAVQPWKELYLSIELLATRCLLSELTREIPAGMTVEDIARLCSHRHAWADVGGDPSMEEGEWALILEDDVLIHPNASDPREMILEAMRQSVDNDLNSELIFLGMNNGFCSDFGCGVYNWTLFSSSSSSDRREGGGGSQPIGKACAGFGSHAYLLTKRLAGDLFHHLYEKGSGCQHHHCQIDQVFYHRYLYLCSGPDGNTELYGGLSLVGPHLETPHDSSHRGLIYPTREWRPVSATTEMISIADGDWAPSCFTMKLDGRLGNMMFIYASLTGICKVALGLDPEECASVSQPMAWSDVALSFSGIETSMRPMKEFLSRFQIPHVSCPRYHITYAENWEDSVTIRFDPRVFSWPPGITLSGYFQSYKYFHPHMQQKVLQLYTFPLSVVAAGDRFIRSVKETVLRNELSTSSIPVVEDPDDQVSLTCVSVRRGDKTRNPSGIYNPWPLSLEYYLQAIEYVRCCSLNLTGEVRTNRGRFLALVLFVGGAIAKDDIEQDRQWAMDTIASAFHQNRDDNAKRNYTARNIFMEPQDGDHFMAMYTMSRCDNLVVSSSSFSWWSAYFMSSQYNLSRTSGEGREGGAAEPIIVAPRDLHNLNVTDFEPDDYYLPEWTLLSEDRASSRFSYPCQCGP